MPEGGTHRSDEYTLLRLEFEREADRAWMAGNGRLCIALIERLYELYDAMQANRAPLGN